RLGDRFELGAALRMRGFEVGARRRHGLADRRAIRPFDGLDRFAHVVQRRGLAEEAPLGVSELLERRRGLDGGLAVAGSRFRALRELAGAHAPLRRWRAASYNRAVPAIATFSDSAARTG